MRPEKVVWLFVSQKNDRSLSRAQALRKSMLEMIDTGEWLEGVSGKVVASYAHPFFWAPFVVVGEPGTE